MPETKRPLKVFICHAPADRDSVSVLYDRLKQLGADVWLDKENILPGQFRELEIRKAVRKVDVVVVCLSKQFNQAGLRQKEVRLALDTAMEKPEGEIFIVPARLEECETLESLRHLQWVDLFEESDSKKLIQALSLRAQQIDAIFYGDTVSKINVDEFTLEGEASKLFNLGSEYQKRGDFANAIKYNNQAFMLSSKQGNTKAKAAITSNLASVYGKSGDLIRATELYDLATEINVGGYVSDSIIIAGSGNVVNLNNSKVPSPTPNEDKKKQREIEVEKLESQALQYELKGDFWNARKTWYDIKRIDPLFPLVDIKIRELENELQPKTNSRPAPQIASWSAGLLLSLLAISIILIFGIVTVSLLAPFVPTSTAYLTDTPVNTVVIITSTEEAPVIPATVAFTQTLENTITASPSPESNTDKMTVILQASLLEGKTPLRVNFNARTSYAQFADGSIVACETKRLCDYTFTVYHDSKLVDTFKNNDGVLSYTFGGKGQYLVTVYVCRGEACDDDGVIINAK